MKRLVFIAVACILLFSSRLFAHTGSIDGVIVDNITNLPVEGVLISSVEDHLEIISDSNGYFLLENIPVKNYTLAFEKEGYTKKEVTIFLQEDKEVTVNIHLVTLIINLPDLVVIGDIPVSAASSPIISLIDLQLRPKNSAQDMLRLVPGLFIAQHAGGGKAEQIFVRGFDCDHGTDVATYVDDIPINMPSHGHGQGYADLHFLIPETVEKMDVTKGPYFAENGDFSTGATVRFNTRDELEHNELFVELGSAPTQRALSNTRVLGMVQLPLQSNELTCYIAGDYIFNQSYFDAPQNFYRYTIFSKTNFYFSKNTKLSLSMGGFGSSWDASGQIPERAVKDGSIDRFGYIDSLEGGTTSRNNLNLEFISHSGKNEFFSQVFASSYRFRLFSNFTFFLNDPVNGDMIEQTDDRTIFGYNGRYEIPGQIGSVLTITTIGGGFRSDKIQNSLWHSPERVRLSQIASANIYEQNMYGFIKEKFIFNKVSIEPAIRFNYFTFDVEDLIQTNTGHENYSGYNYQFLPAPKLNIVYTPFDYIHLFFNSGLGFHSNDARSVVQEPDNHILPLAAGAELGTQMRFGRFLYSIALWTLELENELVFVGDEGTTEDNGLSRRRGIDFSLRCQVMDWLFADADINFSDNHLLEDFFGSELPGDNIIPLAPTLTSTVGITVEHPKGWEGSLRYRYMKDRPANESNTVTALGYTVIDLGGGYHTEKWRLGLNVENLLNTEWNEAQFDTESRLFDEPVTVDELHFTPGTPISLRVNFAYYF